MKSHIMYFVLAVLVGGGAVYFYKTKCKKCCSGGEKNVEIKLISAQELKQEMEDNDNLVVINVLDKETYDDCKIPDSVNYDYENLKDTAKSLDKSKDYVVYCASKMCHASKEAFKILNSMGFKVRAFEDGMKGWKDEGFETEGPCQAGYLK